MGAPQKKALILFNKSGLFLYSFIWFILTFSLIWGLLSRVLSHRPLKIGRFFYILRRFSTLARVTRMSHIHRFKRIFRLFDFIHSPVSIAIHRGLNRRLYFCPSKNRRPEGRPQAIYSISCARACAAASPCRRAPSTPATGQICWSHPFGAG